MMGNILDGLKHLFCGKKWAEKKIALAILMFVLLPHSLFSESDPSRFNVIAVFSERDFLARFPDRSEGSDGETNAFFLITETLKEGNIPYVILPFEDLDTACSRSLIVETVIKGRSDTEVVLVVPVNTGEDNPSGGNFNIPLALETIRLLDSHPGEMTLRVLFIGSEKRDGPQKPPLGSTYYVETIREENPAMVVYLDLDYLPERLHLDTGTGNPVTPLWLLQSTDRALDRAGLESRFSEAAIHLARTGLSGWTSPLTPWLEDEIPAIRLTTGDSVPLTREWEQKTMVSRMSRFLAELTSLYPSGLPSEWDSNYAAFNLPRGGGLLIPETNLVLVFYLLIAFLVVFSLFQERKIRFNIRRDIRYLWTGPVFLFLTFLFLFLSTLMLELVCAFRDFPTLWREAPRIFLTFKITLTFLLTLAFLHLIGGLPVSRSPHFYSYAAVLTALINIMILSMIHVSLSIYYLWTLLLLILFQVSRTVFVKTLLAFLMPVLTILGLYQMISTSHPDFVHMLLLSRKTGNLLISMGILPYLFVLSSLNNHSFHYTGSRRKTGVFVSTLSSGLLAAVFLFYILFMIHPWTRREQPLEITRRIDFTVNMQTIRLESLSPLPDLSLNIPGGKNITIINPGRKRTLTEPYSGPEVIVTKKKTRFLNREKYTLRMEAPGRVRTMDLTLKGDKALQIYNCNYPFELSPDGLSARIFTEKNPSRPLTLEITLLAGDSGRLETDLSLSDFESPLSATGQNLAVRQLTILHAVIPLGNEIPAP